jgi:hypothetical protein
MQHDDDDNNNDYDGAAGGGFSNFPTELKNAKQF